MHVNFHIEAKLSFASLVIPQKKRCKVADRKGNKSH